MRENADQNNSEYGHFLRSVSAVVLRDCWTEFAETIYEKSVLKTNNKFNQSKQNSTSYTQGFGSVLTTLEYSSSSFIFDFVQVATNWSGL